MDGKYVIFGRVVQGMRAFKMIDKMDTVNERPLQAVKIVEANDFNGESGSGSKPSTASSMMRPK